MYNSHFPTMAKEILEKNQKSTLGGIQQLRWQEEREMGGQQKSLRLSTQGSWI